jgi:hypothetical protein
VSTTRARSGPRTLLAIAAALGLLFSLSSVAFSSTEHCPGQPSDDPNKVESVVDGDLDGVVLDAGTIFCIKAGTETFPGVADGTTSLVEYAESAGIVGGDGQGRNISHYVTYGMSTPTPEPTPTDEATPTPTPTDEATPTPTPTPTEGESPAEETPAPTPEEVQGGTPSPREDTAGGNPTPTPGGGTLPDTATGGMGQVPATVLSLVLLAALAATAYARLARQS